jgi:hypothetical protein
MQHTFSLLPIRPANHILHAPCRLSLHNHLQGFGASKHREVGTAQGGLQVLAVHVGTFTAVMEHLEFSVPRLCPQQYGFAILLSEVFAGDD